MFIRHPPILMNLDLLQKIKPPASSWNPGPRTLLRLTGEDRLRFLNGQVTQDLKKLLPGQAVRAAVTTAKGRLEADTRIASTRDALFLETDSSLRESLRARLEKFLVADDVTIDDLSNAYSLAHFPTLTSPPTQSPSDCLAFTCARFRQPGLDLWIPSSSAWKPSASPILDWEPLRIAAGLPLWSVDVDANTLPPEAGFESDAISSTKGCYIGQEVISRLRSVGHVNRNLCILATDSLPMNLNLPCDTTNQEGAILGKITSIASLSEQPTCLALSMIKRDFAQPGNSVLANGTTWTILRHA